MLDNIREFLGTGSQEVPDYLEVLGLSEWYLGLSESETEMLYQYSESMGMGNLLEGPVKSTTQAAQGYLQTVGSKAISDKNYRFAEKVLLKAIETEDSNPTDRHFVYNELIDLFYKQRDERDDAIEKCIKYCKRDIDTIDEFLNDFLEEYGGEPPRIPAFKRLAIIYEKRGEYRDALEICDIALQYEQEGFEKRKERLNERIEG
ncbi:tetratricopeptide repeat protein [Halovenus rubra]|uniref:Tetratricopeptide repeat protein n=2 Tax=Halovenus rubra TaxID=869890 RepID=A0ABD5X9G6_9EURY|nr:tetratricopeptide repeat protein [Halovenus rubra]